MQGTIPSGVNMWPGGTSISDLPYLEQQSGSGIRIGHASIISNPAELFIGIMPCDVMLTGCALVPYSLSDLIESLLAGLTSFLAHKHTA